MRIRKKLILMSFALILPGILGSCGKNWLDAKPDKLVVVPESLQDFQALLDNSDQLFNIYQASGLGEIGAGDFYILYSSWQSLYSSQERSAYLWEETSKFYNGEFSSDWQNAYKRILNTNIILYGVEKIKPAADQLNDWNNVKGSALFFRSFNFFCLAQEYCKAYVSSSADHDPGLPLRTDYDVNINVGRSSVRLTYDQVIRDLKTSLTLLDTEPKAKTRPSRQAAFALLARVYLAMEVYDEAGLYADSALQIQPELMHYSTLRASDAYPFSRFSTEVIFHSTFSYGIFNASRLLVEPDLYASYAQGDYRRVLFFSKTANGMTFRGGYSGDKNLFGGLATNELYLIRAECNARTGKVAAAMTDLNELLRTRWNGNFVPFETGDPERALEIILKERKKELVFRGLRWTDLRRLNNDDRFKVTLTRKLNGKTYTLEPGDKRYVLPIDENEIRLSGIAQNDRGDGQ